MTPPYLQLEYMLWHVLEPFKCLGLLDVRCTPQGRRMVVVAKAGKTLLIHRTIVSHQRTARAMLDEVVNADFERLAEIAGQYVVVTYSESGNSAAGYYERDILDRAWGAMV